MRTRFGPLALLLACTSCGRQAPAPAEFVVVRDSLSARSASGTASAPARRVYLNEEIQISFADLVDPLTVTPDTVRVRELGNGALVRGRLSVGTRTVSFVPQPPCQATLDDGSFRPGRRYRLEVAGFPSTNAVRAASGRLLARSLVREFETVGADHAPSPFLPVGVGDPQTARFELAYFEPVAADLGTLRLHFNVPPDPRSVTPAAFRVQRLNSGVERLPIAATRVLPAGDALVQTSDFARVASYPGSIVEVQIGARLVPGRDLYLSFEQGASAVRDYGGRSIEDFLAGAGRLPVLTIPVQPGDRVRVFELGFREHIGFGTVADAGLGFQTKDGCARPACRREAGQGSLGVFRPQRDTLVEVGQPFDRGDGTLVTAASSSFEFREIEVPAGVTVVLRSEVAVRLCATGAIRIAGTLLLAQTPLGTAAWQDGEPLPVAEVLAASGVALLAGEDITVHGTIRREGLPGSPGSSPLTLLCGGRARLFGRIPAGTVLAPEHPVLEGAVEHAKIVRAPLTQAPGGRGPMVAAAWTPWLPLPKARTRADEVRLEGLRGRLQVAVQFAPPSPIDGSRAVVEPALMTEPIPLPLTAPLEWTPGSHVRFLLRAEVDPGEVLPELGGIVFLTR